MQRQFVSYPKSGRTWIRFILSQLNCHRSILFHHDCFEFSDGSKPRHSFDLAGRLERYGETDKVAYLERDPRDVMVSLYYQVTGRFGDVFQYAGSLSEFIRDEYFGAVNLRRFRAMWDLIVERRGFLKLSYEACHLDTARTLQQLLTYYDIDVDPADLSIAIGKGSLANMKQVEASMEFPEPWLRYRNDSPKVRRGEVGGFRLDLSDDDIEFLNSVFEL